MPTVLTPEQSNLVTIAVIVNRFGVVHRITCNLIAEIRVIQKVTPKQCLVFKLPACRSCWSPDVYDRFLGRVERHRR